MVQPTPKPVVVGTAAELANYRPSAGELTHESDTGIFRAGDGVTLHSALPQAGGTLLTQTAAASTYAPIKPAQLSPLFGALGDSLSLNTDNTVQRVDSPLHYASLRAGGKIRYVYMGGITGQTSTQIAARATDFVAAGAKTIVVLMGANDTTGTGPWATTKANLDATIAAILTAGGTPVLATLPPRGTAASPPSTAQKQFVATYNLYVRRQSAVLGTPVVDFYTALADSANDYYSSATQNDGLHPNAAGWSGMGSVLSSAVTGLLPASATPLPTANMDQASLTDNCLMLNNGSGLATGWAVAAGAANVTPTVAAATVGNKQVITCTGSSAQYALWRNNIAVTAGHVLQIVGVMSWTGVAAVLQIDSITSGATTFGVAKPTNQSPAAITAGVIDYLWTVPAGVDHFNVELVAKAGTGSVELSQFAVYDLTAQNVL